MREHLIREMARGDDVAALSRPVAKWREALRSALILLDDVRRSNPLRDDGREACENCRKRFPLAKMVSDRDGIHLCRPCADACLTPDQRPLLDRHGVWYCPHCRKGQVGGGRNEQRTCKHCRRVVMVRVPTPASEVSR